MLFTPAKYNMWVLLLTSIICLMHTELLRHCLWCSVVAVTRVTLHAASWLEKVNCENMDKIPFKLITFLLNFMSSFCIWSFVLYEHRHKKAEHICSSISFSELSTLSPGLSLLYAQLSSSSFMRIHQLILTNCLERFGDRMVFQDWFWIIETNLCFALPSVGGYC